MSLEGRKSGLRPRRLRGFRPAWWIRLAETAEAWAARWRTRRRMTRLSDHMLRDIGVARADLEREVGKAFWRK
jgi:uncharacterized protein YjiS (DUF1127 family)